MAGLEEAAQAFETVISKDAKTGAANAKSSEGPLESMFKNLGQLEVDENSDVRGGGDEDESVKAKSNPRNPRENRSDDSDNSDESLGEGDDDDAGGEEEEGSGEEEEEAGAGEDDESDEGDDSERTGLLAQKVEVTVDGSPVEVTVKEALEGYIRTQTFHQRMNQLDEAKKVVRKAAADAVTNYEYSMNMAKQMEQFMEQMVPKEPDWDAEFAKDPARARELQRYYEKLNTFKATLKTQTEEANKRMADHNSAQLVAFIEEESQKFDYRNRKNWSNPKNKQKDLQSMRRTALAEGFTEGELSQVYDSRMLMILLKASKYDRMMAAKPKPIVRIPGKPIPPGTGSAKQRTVNKGVNSAMKRLNRTGSLEDAASVMNHIIAGN